jgi:hypothetical protein
VLDRRVAHAPRILGLRDVADDADQLAASTRDALAEPIQPLAVDVACDDPRPLSREQLRRRSADTHRGTRDHRRLAEKPACGCGRARLRARL